MKWCSQNFNSGVDFPFSVNSLNKFSTENSNAEILNQVHFVLLICTASKINYHKIPRPAIV